MKFVDNLGEKFSGPLAKFYNYLYSRTSDANKKNIKVPKNFQYKGDFLNDAINANVNNNMDVFTKSDEYTKLMAELQSSGLSDAEKTTKMTEAFNAYEKANPNLMENYNAATVLPSLAWNAVKTHPMKAIGLGALGAGNIGGLTDNNKFGGQLGGLALGGLGAMGLGLGPANTALLTLGGGELGALFDKLRAKKEQEDQYARRGY